MGSIGSFLIKKGYSNKEKLKLIKSPTLVIHGRKDTLISCEQSAQIFEELQGKAELILHDEMTHNSIDTMRHLVLPMTNFIAKAGIKSKVDAELGMPLRYFDFDSAA